MSNTKKISKIIKNAYREVGLFSVKPLIHSYKSFKRVSPEQSIEHAITDGILTTLLLGIPLTGFTLPIGVIGLLGISVAGAAGMPVAAISDQVSHRSRHR